MEGVATWVESTLSGGGGRLNDARVRGLLASLALEGSWPDLRDASLSTYAPWPGGQTRYLLGAGFIEHLVARHGFGTLRSTLRSYNAGGLLGDFSAAWSAAAGTDLGEEWEAFRQTLSERAEVWATRRDEAELLTDSGGLTGRPMVAPDGRRLAWVTWPPAIAVAELTDSGLVGTRSVRLGVFPSSLDWLDDETLVYTRIDRQANSNYAELFALDLASGRERRLTVGARASFASADGEGCIWHVRDVEPGGSSLRRWCQDGGLTELWHAPAGSHLVGLDVSPGGRVAVSVWRAGQVDLALFEQGAITLLTDDPGHDIDPSWSGEETLRFASDRSGVYEIYDLAIAEGEQAALQRRSASLGGSFQPATGDVFVRLGPEGYELARLDSRIGETVALSRTDSVATETPAEVILPTRTYRPFASLAPFAWLPTDGAIELSPGRAALEVMALGQDDSGEHSYALTIGHDTALAGHLGGSHIALRYALSEAGLAGTIRPPGSVSAALRVGVWPHVPHLGRGSETAAGIEVDTTATLLRDPVFRVRLRVGLVHLQSAAAWQPRSAGRGALRPPVRRHLRLPNSRSGPGPDSGEERYLRRAIGGRLGRWVVVPTATLWSARNRRNCPSSRLPAGPAGAAAAGRVCRRRHPRLAAECAPAVALRRRTLRPRAAHPRVAGAAVGRRRCRGRGRSERLRRHRALLRCAGVVRSPWWLRRGLVVGVGLLLLAG